MGQVVIEIPQNIYATYQVDDAVVSEQLLDELEPFNESFLDEVIPPTDTDRKKALDAVIGIWADREESAQEIARKIRENNRRVT